MQMTQLFWDGGSIKTQIEIVLIRGFWFNFLHLSFCSCWGWCSFWCSFSLLALYRLVLLYSLWCVLFFSFEVLHLFL